MKRFVSCLMSLVLVVGLMPLPAYAQRDARETTARPAALAASAISTQVDASDPYDVSNGQYKPYEPDTIRRLYTRPVTIHSGKDDPDKPFQSVAIDLQNEIYQGAGIAVRYTGDRPRLAFYDTKWRGWTDVRATDENTVQANDSTGQEVAFFPYESIEASWAQGGGNPERLVDVTVNGEKQKSGVKYERQCMSVCVEQSGDQACRLVEVVAVGCAEKKIDPTKSERYEPITDKSVEEIAEAMKAGYNMAGHFESNWVPETQAKDGGWSRADIESEAHWTRGVYVKRDTIRNLKTNGFNAIRLPVTWFQHIYPIDDPKGDSATRTDLPLLDRYHIDRAFIERLHEVVDWCIAENMYVIVNIHHEDWIDRPDLGTAYVETDLPLKFQAVWTQIANEFDSYDQHLVFEDMNEPHQYIPDENGKMDDWGYSTTESVTTVNRLNDDFVKLMRGFSKESGHQDRMLMMAHETGNGDLSYTNFVMPDDPSDKLALSLHMYSPHDWTHYFAEGKHANEDGEANEYTDSYSEDVEAAWERYRARYTSQGYPIILGEFGCYYYGDSEKRQYDRRVWMTQYATHAKELGIPMFYWRMDRTMKDAEGNEKIDWSAFNEETQEFSDRSKDMIEKWLSIVNDNETRWGSNATIDEGEHIAIENGTQLQLQNNSFTLPKTIVSTQNVPENEQNERCRAFFKLDWSQLENNEIAVKFSGATPRICVLHGSKGNWWGKNPTSVDEVNHIAYFTDDSIQTLWEKTNDCEGEVETNLDRIFFRTPDSGYKSEEDANLTTTIEAVALVHKHEWLPWKTTSQTDKGEPVEERTCDCALKDACPAKTQTRIVHEWGPWTTTQQATCTQGRIQVRTCIHHAGVTQTRTTPAKGHWWNGGEVIRAAAPHVDGLRKATCITCNAQGEIPIPALGHDWDDWTLLEDATCTSAGVEQRVCQTDPSHVATRKSETNPARGHDWGEWALLKEADCTSAGIEQRICKNDKTHIQTRESETEPALGHIDDGGKTVRDATEDSDGEIIHTCERCGEVLSRTSIPKTSSQQDISSPGQQQEDEQDQAESQPPNDTPAEGDSPGQQQEDEPNQAESQPLKDTSAEGDSLEQATPAEQVIETENVAAKSGGAALTVDVGPGNTAIITSAKSAKGTVKVDTVKTADGRTLKVTEIAPNAFKGSKAKKIVLGSNVKKVGKGAFKNCKKLKSLTLGKNVKSIGKGALQGCKKLVSISVRSSKLTKASFTNLLKGTKIQLVKLVDMSKSVKKKALTKYTKWLPEGVRIK